jgi:hypothetical protein
VDSTSERITRKDVDSIIIHFNVNWHLFVFIAFYLTFVNNMNLYLCMQKCKYAGAGSFCPWMFADWSRFFPSPVAIPRSTSIGVCYS